VQNEKGEKKGRIQNMQVDGKTVTEATSGQEVAVSISDATMGRTLFESDILLTYITPNMRTLVEKISLSDEEKMLLDTITNLQSTLDNPTPEEK
ncbi:MAG: translation initiation factor IF-2, partial [archaeon]